MKLSEEDEDESESEEEVPEDEENMPPPLGKGERNSHLTVGYKGDRSYVVRGSTIGVFSHTGDNVKYMASIKEVTTPKGVQFNPSQVRSLAL